MEDREGREAEEAEEVRRRAESRRTYSVKLPFAMKLLTAFLEFRMIKNSATSPPT